MAAPQAPGAVVPVSGAVGLRHDGLGAVDTTEPLMGISPVVPGMGFRSQRSLLYLRVVTRCARAMMIGVIKRAREMDTWITTLDNIQEPPCG